MWILARRRLFDAAIVVWLVGTLSFALLHLAPSDPIAAAMTDPRVAPSVRAHWRAAYALDQPLIEQYARYVAALARGDLGYSFSQFRPVADALGEALPYSFLLMGTSLVTSVIIGAAIGAWQAVRAGKPMDRTLSVVTSGLGAIPEVWLALMLLTVLGAEFAIFPLSGRCDPVLCGTSNGWRALIDGGYHLVLPALTLTLLFSAVFARVQRVALHAVLHDEITRRTRAKGVSERRLLTHHAMRRAARPLATTVGLSLPALVGGSVFIERVFGWPGMGSLLVSAIGVRDYPLVTATAMIGSLLVLFGSLLTDGVAALLDPRWTNAST